MLRPHISGPAAHAQQPRQLCQPAATSQRRQHKRRMPARLSAEGRSGGASSSSSRPDAGNRTLLDILVRPLTSLGQVASLNQGIATFYDQSSELWENMWGSTCTMIDMIEEVLKWADVKDVKSMVDVGCGIGGSSRHILNKYPGARAQGITLSPKQAARANALTEKAGMSDRASFQVGDALAQPFDDASFDLVWSLESGEHMPDKTKFVNELARVCSPGGQVIVVTWCHRVLGPGETSLRPEEQSLLERICEAYYLPAWCSEADYKRLFEAAGMKDVRTADWSEEVAPFWKAVIRSALSGAGFAGLLRAGWTTIKGALVMPLMAQGFQMGLIKFNLITATKAQQ